MRNSKTLAFLGVSYVLALVSLLACTSVSGALARVAPRSAPASVINASDPSSYSASALTVHHSLMVALDPFKHSLAVTDRLRFPSKGGRVRFSLHAGLSPKVATQGVSLTSLGERAEGELKVEEFELELAPSQGEVELTYSGEIFHPLHDPSSEAERGITETPGLISEEGISLFGETYWYPHVSGAGFMTFDLTTTTPPGWIAVSQGVRTRHDTGGALWVSRWESPEKQESIHLNAAVFQEMTAKSGPVELMVFLRTPDSALGNRYLAATDRYLRMYMELLGSYPYGKFALVENFWDTGYGMPSFTLIGSNVLRLPFIINTSYPHEILHDWWGNGVYVDESTGNWCEGTTSYMADHLLAEQAGTGVAYRRDTLNQFTSSVAEANDFALSKFVSRFDPVTSAIGYGKSLMFFHMLRVKLGDELFVKGFRRFYNDRRFTAAGYDDIRAAFEAEKPGLDLKEEFHQWVDVKGAPTLAVREAWAERTAKAYRLHLKVAQTQSYGPVYSLRIPIAVHLKSESEAYQTFVTMPAAEGSEKEWTMDFPALPYRVEVDPEYDVFRRLSPGEMPPSFTRAYGASRTIAILPTAVPQELQDSYRRFAEAVEKNQSGSFELRTDKELKSLSELKGDGAVWILGSENRFAAELSKGLSDYGVKLAPAAIEVQGQSFARTDHAFALTLAPEQEPKQTWIWISLDSKDHAAAAPILGTKLPHYGKNSFAVFEVGASQGGAGGQGTSPVTVSQRLSGQWPTINSPLSVLVRQPAGGVQDLPRARLKPRAPLVQ